MKRTACFCLVVLLCGGGLLHTMASQPDSAIKIAYTDSVRKRQAMPEPARIWSRKCERRGQLPLARQADGGMWEVHCVSGEGLKA